MESDDQALSRLVPRAHPKVLVVGVTSQLHSAIVEMLSAKGVDVSQIALVEPDSPEGEALLREGHCPDLTPPFGDEHLEETPDRKLAAQLSPRQAVLPPNLRRRRP